MKKFIGLLILIIVFGLPAYVYMSPTFERIPPKIKINHSPYWNLRDNLEIKISDNTGIKFYKVVLIADGKAKILKKETFAPSEIEKEVVVNVKLPEFYQVRSNTVEIKVEAVDNSKWNYFAGNESRADKEFYIDKVAPITEVINNNYSMKRGGSGIAIVKVKDDYLKKAYIKVTDRDNPENYIILKLTPFYKKDYYISLLAWPYNFRTFSADLYAYDKAGNLSISHIPIRWRRAIYPKAKIKITDRFIKVVAIPLLTKMGMDIPQDAIEIFRKINVVLRKMNEEKLYNVTNILLEKEIKNFYIKPFKPLKGYVKKASYGERRTYFYKGEEINFAVHKGLDIASYRHARIYASNNGKVIFEGFNGIYGNTLALYHKIGLVSTYSHCSDFNVADNSYVSRGSLLAHTGSTGAVFGDHLHFGIYIQGIPVEPLEWMDAHWIKDNITGIIIKAKRIINR